MPEYSCGPRKHCRGGITDLHPLAGDIPDAEDDESFRLSPWRGWTLSDLHLGQAGRAAMTAVLAAQRASCAAIAKMMSLRIIDPVLYPLYRRRKRPGNATHVLPVSAQVARSQQRQKEGGFDWI